MNKGIMINIDDTHFLHSRTAKTIEVNEGTEVVQAIVSSEHSRFPNLTFF